MAVRFKSKCASTHGSAILYAGCAARADWEGRRIDFELRVNFYTRHLHFRGRRYIFIISNALIVGWKINLVLLKI